MANTTFIDTIKELEEKEVEFLLMKCANVDMAQIGEKIGHRGGDLYDFQKRVFVKFGANPQQNMKAFWNKNRKDICKALRSLSSGEEEKKKKKRDPVVYFLGVVVLLGLCGVAVVIGAVQLFGGRIGIPTIIIGDEQPPVDRQADTGVIPEEELLEIEQGVSLRLRDIFGNRNYVGCFAPDPGGVLLLQILNDSGDDFLLRYSPETFSVVDDTGKSYEIEKSGVGRCSDDPRPQSVFVNSGQSTQIQIAFRGEFPEEARFLILTVESISGYGPFQFRKDL